ncbi:DNA topoisomerase III, putative [Candida dubliniensis CD36]|uniref:DNA topoisomerase n=1 Tax=Candida dubliniensis (strain CD36 / ATCC MYA-646 / CBS 7987 / NCPF 3949 / NRRL Y-17841) TaxID=573826 RepID=B9WE65_CANDC|nr:DNA topoisomerase III, putative [Candida dubliniensis CD36]CAX42976.1 DNA topoisomerase III, putative [Candida dubliniensis CD36]
MKILCVAEKPSIAKAVANILGGGRTSLRDSSEKFIKNYDFTFTFKPEDGPCQVTMTSVVGHITNLEFESAFAWGKCVPGRLFDADILTVITKKAVHENIAKEARNADKLMIWTDCDREGEYIGFEIMNAAKKYNRNLELNNIWRAKFSHLERNHIIRAAKNPVNLDMSAVAAVSCRMEVDFRVGTSFTRLLTDQLRQKGIIDGTQVASYGTCQFPTLGFVVDRYKRVKNFIPEPFWHIEVETRKENKKTVFNWVRGHFFDKLYVVMLYEQCCKSGEYGIISKIESKRKPNFRPFPLTTVELQKDCARFFKMSAKAALEAAEKLYNQGFLSYPRTETDRFAKETDFRSLLEVHKQDSRWGSYTTELLSQGYQVPRSGSHDDKAHPPIHPIKYVSLDTLKSINEKKVYEYVVRRFIACCSKDAVGMQTVATLKWGDEFFTANGLMVLEKNYLDVYIYKKWESSKQLPKFTEGERIKLASGVLKEGKTSPPNHMTEPELIALMDANGIGTDATIAEHIHKIENRGYIAKSKKGKNEFIVPSLLGMGLIDGLDKMEFEDISLSKPFLRKSLERSLEEIATGSRSKVDVLNTTISVYLDAFGVCSHQILVLCNECRRVLRGNSSNNNNNNSNNNT